MTNSALELAKIFQSWRALGQTTGDQQLLEMAAQLGMEKHEALFHVATLLSGVQAQIRQLESREIDTSSYRATEPAWINAAFMTSTGWGGTARHPDHIISEASINVLHSLGVLHGVADLKDGQKSTLFGTLLSELTPTIELIESLSVPEILKSLAIKCALALKNELECPLVDIESVMSKYSELVGFLATMATFEPDENKRSAVKDKTAKLLGTITGGVAVNLLTQGIISGVPQAIALIAN